MNRLGLFSQALVYAKRVARADFPLHGKRLEAAALRHAAKRLNQTGEANTGNAQLLLTQLAEELEE